MQKTPLYKRCLPALALILALMLPLVSLAEVSKVVKGGALNMRAEPSLSAHYRPLRAESSESAPISA